MSERHRVVVDTRLRRTQFLARCECGWSAGWFRAPRIAQAAADQHRLAARAA